MRAELERATQYWLATRRPDGRAHVVPLDGVWLDDVWYYGGSEQAVHYRNVLADPGVVMHLPDPMKAVIVEGDARLAHPSPELARRLAETANAKYGYGQDPAGYQGALGLYPRTVRAWTAFPRTPPGSGSREAASANGWTVVVALARVGAWTWRRCWATSMTCSQATWAAPARRSGSPR